MDAACPGDLCALREAARPILLGRSDYTLGHLTSHMPRSRWHHIHLGSLGSDTPENVDSLEGSCDLIPFVCLPGFWVPSRS